MSATPVLAGMLDPSFSGKMQHGIVKVLILLAISGDEKFNGLSLSAERG